MLIPRSQFVECLRKIHHLSGKLWLHTKSEWYGMKGKKGTVQPEVDQGCRVSSGGSPWDVDTMSRHNIIPL